MGVAFVEIVTVCGWGFSTSVGCCGCGLAFAQLTHKCESRRGLALSPVLCIVWEFPILDCYSPAEGDTCDQ